MVKKINKINYFLTNSALFIYLALYLFISYIFFSFEIIFLIHIFLNCFLVIIKFAQPQLNFFEKAFSALTRFQIASFRSLLIDIRIFPDEWTAISFIPFELVCILWSWAQSLTLHIIMAPSSAAENNIFLSKVFKQVIVPLWPSSWPFSLLLLKS